MTNPETQGSQRPSRVCSPCQDCVVPPPNSQVCSASGPWVEVEQRKEPALSGGGETGREDGCGSGRFQTSSSLYSTVFFTQPLSRAACAPKQAELWLALAALQTYGCPVLRGGLCFPGLGTPAREGAHLFPETRLSRARAVLQKVQGPPGQGVT